MQGLHPLWLIILLFFVPDCLAAQLRIVVDTLPAYTPAGDSLYLTGSFNDWVPNDERFRLEPMAARGYSYDFLTPLPDFDFKITRGDWASVEGGRLAEPIGNRRYVNNGELRDTVRLTIRSWEDMEARISAIDSLRIEVVSLPPNTPAGDQLYVTGSFNGWSPKDSAHQLKRDGKHFIARVPLREEVTTYKITRGSWATVESKENGLALANRTFALTAEDRNARVEVSIANWEDLAGAPYGWLDILLAISALGCLLLAGALLLNGPGDERVNYWLASGLGLIGTAALVRLAGFQTDIFQAVPKAILLPDLACFLLPPLMVESIQRLVNTEDNSRNWVAWYYFPFGLAALGYASVLLLSDYNFITRVVNGSLQPKLTTVAGVGLLVNLWFARVAYGNWKNSDTQNEGGSLAAALGLWAAIALGLWTINAVTSLVFSIWLNRPVAAVDVLTEATWLLGGLLFAPVAYSWVMTPHLFKSRAPEVKHETLELEESSAAISLNHVEAPPSINQSETEAGSEEDRILSEAAQKLTTAMRNGHPYLNPKLTLAELAEAAGLPTYQLSKILNEELGQNYFDFVNAYRIEAFRQRLRAGDHRERTILSLGLEAGFNSKTAFNRAFKKQMGMTPRQFVQTIDNQGTKSTTFVN